MVSTEAANMKKNAKSPLKQCFTTLSDSLGIDIIELWSQYNNEFTLQFIYRIDAINNDDNVISICNNEESKQLCRKSLESQDGFYSPKRNKENDSHFMTKFSFHLSPDNINLDSFIVGFSLDYKSVSYKASFTD